MNTFNWLKRRFSGRGKALSLYRRGMARAKKHDDQGAMNWDQISNNWNEVSDKIKLTWGKLSEDDITAIAGQRDQFARLLQERYEYEKEIAENVVDEFAKALNLQVASPTSID